MKISITLLTHFIPGKVGLSLSKATACNRLSWRWPPAWHRASIDSRGEFEGEASDLRGSGNRDADTCGGQTHDSDKGQQHPLVMCNQTHSIAICSFIIKMAVTGENICHSWSTVMAPSLKCPSCWPPLASPGCPKSLRSPTVSLGLTSSITASWGPLSLIDACAQVAVK